MELIKKTNGKYYQEVYRSHNITLKLGVYEGFFNECAEHDDSFYAPKISLCKGELDINFRMSYDAENIPRVKEILNDIEMFLPEYRQLIAEREAGQ